MLGYLDYISGLLGERYGIPANWMYDAPRYVPGKVGYVQFVEALDIVCGGAHMQNMRMKGKEDAYPYIRSSISCVADFLEWAVRSRRKSFLEIGSGTGRNILALKLLIPYATVTGIDIVPEYNKWARYVWNGTMDVRNIDAFEFKEYRRYTTILGWCPQVRHVDVLYKHIYTEMAPRTVYYELVYDVTHLPGASCIETEIKSHPVRHMDPFHGQVKRYLVKK